MNNVIKQNYKIACYCFLSAFLVLLICSKSSYLYPINDWTDANIYFSMGKGITEGKVIYRDLYDHKGPILYFLHALCAVISFDNFLGVFWLEVICGTFFLYYSYNIARYLGAGKNCIVLLPLLGAIIFSSFSFLHGDSTEELCLPILAYTLLVGLKFTKENQVKPFTLFWVGFWVGVVFFIKFTLVGLQISVCLWIVGYFVLTKQWKKAFENFGILFLGFIVAIIPWIIYFIANGAIIDFLNVYFFDNLVLYASNEPTVSIFKKIFQIASSILDWIKQNLIYTIPMFFGFIYIIVKKTKKTTWFVLFSFALSTLFVFIGAKSYPYYGLALAVFASIGYATISINLPSFTKGKVILFSVLAIIISVVISLTCSINVNSSFLMKKDTTMQYNISNYITEKNPNILNYNFMDAGFFTAIGVSPQVKYFHRNNVPKKEMLEKQKEYILNGQVDYIISREPLTEDLIKKYILITTTEATEGFWYDTIYLYKGTSKK